MDQLPFTPQGRVSWKTFYAGAEIGRKYTFDIRYIHCCRVTAQGKERVIKVNDNKDGTFTLKILNKASQKERMLYEFSQLCEKELRAIYNSCVKLKMLQPLK